MSVLWTGAAAAQATGGTLHGNWSVTGVSIDTRTLEPGDLFVALKDVRDGHDFVAQALESGAGAALVSRIPDGVPGDAPLLIVDDVLNGLEALGRAARVRTQARVVGVTGSVGKTSTKEMLRDVLACQGRTHASVASYINHWGVPLTLARMPADTEYAVIEMGMNHPGEIAPLSRMARPHVALVTTVAAAHLEAFEDIDGIAVEKASIMAGLPQDGVVVLNADVPTRPTLEREAAQFGFDPVWFGTASRQFTLNDVNLTGHRTIVQATCHDAPVIFKLSTAGRHFAMNGLGVLAVVDALGADLAVAAMDLALWVPPGGDVHEDETFEAAVVREIEEETGIVLKGDLPWIWTRDHQLMYEGELRHFHERYFVARVEAPAKLHNRTDEPIIDARWWKLEDIEASSETFFPQGLASLLVPVLQNRMADSPIVI